MASAVYFCAAKGELEGAATRVQMNAVRRGELEGISSDFTLSFHKGGGLTGERGKANPAPACNRGFLVNSEAFFILASPPVNNDQREDLK